MKSDSLQFNLNHQYELYLERSGIRGKLPAIQNQEMKRAFIGACGQILICFRDELSKLDDDTAVATMEDMLNQVLDFWTKEQGKAN